jgi:ADP-ribose pyrophosphatase YjhB (NUDIX family)
MSEARRTKRSVAAVLFLDRDEANPRFLAVRRPVDDEALPGVWGLPAASLRQGESWEGAVRRLGGEKLGVELEPVTVLARGSLERPGYRLQMQLYEARIVDGTPVVPQHDRTVTQYVEWRWSTSELLVEGARRGSLCCRLYLSRHGGEEGAIDIGDG